MRAVEHVLDDIWHSETKPLKVGNVLVTADHRQSITDYYSCLDCNGNGHHDGHECHTCDGSGTVKEVRRGYSRVAAACDCGATGDELHEADCASQSNSNCSECGAQSNELHDADCSKAGKQSKVAGGPGSGRPSRGRSTNPGADHAKQMLDQAPPDTDPGHDDFRFMNPWLPENDTVTHGPEDDDQKKSSRRKLADDNLPFEGAAAPFGSEDKKETGDGEESDSEGSESDSDGGGGTTSRVANPTFTPPEGKSGPWTCNACGAADMGVHDLNSHAEAHRQTQPESHEAMALFL